MALWRRRALEAFPELRSTIQQRDSSIYLLLGDLRLLLREVFDAGDQEKVRRIFEFAEWCATQRAKDMWNAAGVSFYEHLFDDPAYSDRMLPWLTPDMVYCHWDLWEYMVDPTEWSRVSRLLRAKRGEGKRRAEKDRSRPSSTGDTPPPHATGDASIE